MIKTSKSNLILGIGGAVLGIAAVGLIVAWVLIKSYETPEPTIPVRVAPQPRRPVGPSVLDRTHDRVPGVPAPQSAPPTQDPPAEGPGDTDPPEDPAAPPQPQ